MEASSPDGKQFSETNVADDNHGEELELADALELILKDWPSAMGLSLLIAVLQRSFGLENLRASDIIAVMRDHPSRFLFRVYCGKILVAMRQLQLEAYFQTTPKIFQVLDSTDHDGSLAYKNQHVPLEHYFPVTVACVTDPGNLVLHVYDKNLLERLAALHDALNELYAGPISAAYSIPHNDIPIGLPCAVPSPSSQPEGRNWRRAVVAGDFWEDMVEVNFVDTPGKRVIHCSDLRVLLNDFLDLPAQNIPAKLAHIQPTSPATGWCHGATDLLVRQTQDKILMCFVEEAGTKPISVLLCDTTSDKVVYPSVTLVEEELASLAN